MFRTSALEVEEVPFTKGHAKDNVAANNDGTMLACVDYRGLRVYIYKLDCAGQCIGDSVVYSPSGVVVSSLCFTLRKGVETLLMHDILGKTLVEIDLNGVFLRRINLGRRNCAYGNVAFCAIQDLIAFSSFATSTVYIINYSGEEEVARVGGRGHSDGQLNGPLGVSFTADGLYFLVADYGNNRLCKFRALDGTFITHLEVGDVFRPARVSEFEDGLLVVGQFPEETATPSIGLFLVASNGAAKSIFTYAEEDGSFSFNEGFACLASSGKIAVNSDGGLSFLSDTWCSTDRAAWVSACSVL
jgi:hypothetical protein